MLQRSCLLVFAWLSCLVSNSMPVFGNEWGVEDSSSVVGTTSTSSATTSNFDSATTEDDDAVASVSEKSVALLADSSQIEALVAWLKKNRWALTKVPLTVPGKIFSRLKWDIPDLRVTALPENGADIVVAGMAASGDLDGVILFNDPSSGGMSTGYDLNLLARASVIGSVPIALGEASASAALRGVGETIVAYLIFNPVSGQGNPDEQLTTIRSILEPTMVLIVIYTQKDRDPADQAREIVNTITASADPSAFILLASGGDGTVSAVGGATMGTGIPFGVIPRGTANAFSVALGIPTDLTGACRNILEGNVRVLDGAQCNDVPMILLAGLGFEAGMVDNAPRELKNLLGPLAYVLGGAQQMIDQESFKCDISIDGTKKKVEATAITVANVAPPTSVLAQGFGEVIPDDGLLEITISTAKTFWKSLEAMAHLLSAAVEKTPTKTDALLCVRAQNLMVDCDPPQKLVIDGEMLEVNPINFSVVPDGLSVIAPAAPSREDN